MADVKLSQAISYAKKVTERYAKTHKGRSNLERECIRKGYLVKRLGEINPNCAEWQRNKLGLFALDFNFETRKGGFTYIY